MQVEEDGQTIRDQTFFYRNWCFFSSAIFVSHAEI